MLLAVYSLWRAAQNATPIYWQITSMWNINENSEQMCFIQLYWMAIFVTLDCTGIKINYDVKKCWLKSKHESERCQWCNRPWQGWMSHKTITQSLDQSPGWFMQLDPPVGCLTSPLFSQISQRSNFSGE